MGNNIWGGRLITNAAGQVEQSTSYTPYGDPQTQNNITTTTPEEHSFIGERFYASTGLLYHNARYYDPALRNGSTSNYTTIPDIWDMRLGVVEAKDVAKIGSTPQLRTQMALSEATGSRFTLVLNSRIDSSNISQQLINEISDVRGRIILYNPNTGLMENFN